MYRKTFAMGDWLGIAIVFGVAIIAFVLKFVIIKCYLNRCGCRRAEPNPNEWTDVEEGPSLEAFFIGDVNAVRYLGRNKGPPPKFEKALKCSSPVQHFIDTTEEEEPPPSYEEYMKGHPQPTLFTIGSSTRVETQGTSESLPPDAPPQTPMGVPVPVQQSSSSGNLLPSTSRTNHETISMEGCQT